MSIADNKALLDDIMNIVDDYVTAKVSKDACKELESRKTNFCPNCGAKMIGGDDNGT